MRRVSIAAVLGLLLASATSCSEEQCLLVPCVGPRPAITLNVRDAVDGGLVPIAMANGFPCGRSTCIPMQADGGTIGVGTSSVDLTAPGYAHVQVVVNVPAATPAPCSCEPEYVPQTEDVPLQPL
ncbi:MAG TPA: hypothetical protein VFI53_09120 [Myxococcaceae bacterium]|nr:hypothetical protein [Myxococcaceae bacterium]